MQSCALPARLYGFSPLLTVFDSADTNIDGDVDTADLTLGFQNFTGAQAASVPEPSSVVLLLLGLMGLAGWRVLSML